MTQQILALWKSQIPSYQKIIARCCMRVMTPLTKFLPSDFQQRTNQLKDILLMKEPQSYEPYIQIIVQHIQGKKNKSIIQLADLLVQQLGGNIKYWQNIILDFAQQVIYTPELSVWHIRKVFEEKLCADPQNLSNYRRLCKLTKTYLATINNLIKYVTKFDMKKDSVAKIDQLFKKVKSAEEKYVGFSEQLKGLQHSNTFDQLSNQISQKSKQNALKDLFHFKDSSRHQKSEKPCNTLFKYNFKVKNKQIDQRVSGPTKNIKDTNKQLVGEQLQIFEYIIKNLRNDKKYLKQLQKQFLNKKQTRKIDQKAEEIPKHLINFTTIWDRDYYFSYITHPIQTQKFNQFTKPFVKHDWINYEINSDDQYQDLIGEDVDNNSQISSVSEMSKNSFVVSDDHYSDDQDAINKQIKPQLSNYLGDRWSFSKQTVYNNRNSYKMELVDTKLKFPLQIAEKNQVEEVLYRIVDGKDKLSIAQAVSKQKIKISKAKLKQFLDKKCKLVVVSQNPYKTIYKILQTEDQNNQIYEKQNISRRSCDYIPDQDQLQLKQNQQDTGMYEPQCLSQPCLQRRLTRGSKRQQSQKIQNGQKQELKGRDSRNNRSSKITNKNSKRTV